MTDKKRIHIVSHTHWDREWYLTLEEYRIKLVDLVDHLLDVLEKDPDYHYFMLDGPFPLRGHSVWEPILSITLLFLTGVIGRGLEHLWKQRALILP